MLVLVSPVESISQSSSALSLCWPPIPAGLWLPPTALVGSALPGLGETPAMSSYVCAVEGRCLFPPAPLLLASGPLRQVPSQPCA